MDFEDRSPDTPLQPESGTEEELSTDTLLEYQPSTEKRWEIK